MRAGPSQEEIRRQNLGALLRYVHVHGATSRAELTSALGLNRSTIGALTAELAAARLVSERAPRETGRAGRPSLVVRPESIGIARDRAQVPGGANAVRARVRDIEYMGAYRTLVLSVGQEGVSGRARIPAADKNYAIGDEVVAWWHPDAQRIVAA